MDGKTDETGRCLCDGRGGEGTDTRTGGTEGTEEGSGKHSWGRGWVGGLMGEAERGETGNENEEYVWSEEGMGVMIEVLKI